jgi:hypothetical protein
MSRIILPLPRSQVLNQSLNAFVFLPGDKYNYKLTSGHITAYIYYCWEIVEIREIKEILVNHPLYLYTHYTHIP